MLVHRVPARSRALAVAPHALELVLAEDGKARLTLLLPPIEDLKEIKSLAAGHLSILQQADDARARIAEDFEGHLKALLAKRERFANSSTFLAHLANLAELSGDYQQEHAFLLEGEKASGLPFFRHRRGVNLISQGETEDARVLFESLDLKSDVGANLRLAYLYVCKENLRDAQRYVDQAILVDPIDFGARLFHGALAIARGDTRSAISSFRVAAEERETSSLYGNLAIAYLISRQSEKAIGALRRAIALEPFNENAVAMLADVTFREKRGKEAIGALEHYLEFEQKSAQMWARYARALIESGQSDKALAALKRQASIQESAGVYNNLGVVHGRLGDKKRAAEYFSFAMQKGTEGEHDYLLAARNLLSAATEAGAFKDVVALGREVIKSDFEGNAARDKILSDIYVLFVYGVAQLRNRQDADVFAERFLKEMPDANARLKVYLAGGLLGSWALRREQWSAGSKLAEVALGWAASLEDTDPRKGIIKNNAAYFYIEMGKFQEGAKLLSEISRWIHKEAYPTATLGLLQIRKGRIEKGEALYREAVRIAKTKSDKQRLTQKMHLELGKALLEIQVGVARRHLQKAIDASDGEEEISREAKAILSRMPRLGS
jgi:Tfp pilus assembly protein PilF